MNSAREYIQKMVHLSLLRAMRRGYSVYVLLVNGEEIYVGQTCDPSVRFRQHKKSRQGQKIDMKVRCIVETQNEAVRVEGELIRILRARGCALENISTASGNSVPGSKDFGGGTADYRPSLLPRSDTLLGPLTKEEQKERRLKIRKMVAGSARMAEIEK